MDNDGSYRLSGGVPGHQNSYREDMYRLSGGVPGHHQTSYREDTYRLSGGVPGHQTSYREDTEDKGGLAVLIILVNYDDDNTTKN